MQALTHKSALIAFPSRGRRSIRQVGLGCRPVPWVSRSRLVVRAEDGDEDAAFEQKLAKLKTSKGEMPIGESRKDKEPKEKYYDYEDEVVFYEGSPSGGDLAVNVVLGATIVWLPLTAASVGRFAFVKYKITDKRVSVTTKAPWQDEQVDVAYQEVADVVAIGRGLGGWGDMVITLKNGDKVEIRSLERWKEIRDYIISRKDAVTKPEESPGGFS